MEHHEKLWLEQYTDSDVLFYRRYVDDILCLFHNECDALLFFHFNNSREKEVDHKLAFLYILIDNTHFPSVITTVYRKKTFTGLLTNYFSFTAWSYKLGLVRTLIDRAFKINNT